MDDVQNESYLVLKEILNVSSCLMITGLEENIIDLKLEAFLFLSCFLAHIKQNCHAKFIYWELKTTVYIFEEPCSSVKIKTYLVYIQIQFQLNSPQVGNEGRW